MGKATFLILDTDYTGKIATGEIRDGKGFVKVGKKAYEWIMSYPKEIVRDGKKEIVWEDVKPISVTSSFGVKKDLYIVKWNSLYPVAFEVSKEKKEFVDQKTGEKLVAEIKNIEPVPTIKFKDTNILPELLAETHDLRFIKSMKKYAAGGAEFGDIFKFILIFVVIFGLGYLIYYFFFRH